VCVRACKRRYKRNWRYHKELKLWLTKESGIEPSQKTSTYERGSYIFFDPITWEKVCFPLPCLSSSLADVVSLGTQVNKEFVLVYDLLDSRPQQPTQQPGSVAAGPLPPL
jgi:hypothetical protein